MVNRRWVLAALAAALVTAAGASVPQAWGRSRLDYLTFSGAVALPGATLPAGTYIFEVIVPGGAGEVVRVSSRDGRGYFMGFTRTVERPRSVGATSAVRFGEAPAGTAPHITIWFPGGSSRGHQFIYPE